MLSPVDESVLRQLVGGTTFARGSRYASDGAVKSRQWSEGASKVVGLVKGGAAKPYQTTVTLTRSPLQQLSRIQGVCTCPVVINCKHAVALLLAGDVTTDGHRGLRLVEGRAKPGPAPKAAGWEPALQALLAGEKQAVAEDELPDIGWQFELVLERPNAGPASVTRRPGIRIRPVVRSPSGNWVRTGMSWSNLDYYSYRRRTAEAPRSLGLAKELVALSRLSDSTFAYGYSTGDVWLEQINSRRLWDLLRQAQDMQLPLINSGRRALPIMLSSSPAAVTLDVTRAGANIRLEPRVAVEGDPVAVRSSLLVGTPAHGIAWWDDSSPGRQLQLAPLVGSIDDALSTFLHQQPITLPDGDEERFFRDFLPAVRRRVAVCSSDDSVELPAETPITLVLSIKHSDGHQTALTWARGRAGSRWREGLWDARPHQLHDRAVENAIVEAVTSIARAMPQLMESTAFGEQLAEAASLEGMAAVRFMTELLPALAEIPGVEIEQTGEVPAYREVVDAPVVNLGGSESGHGDWFDLAVQVTVGGEEVPFSQLFVALAERRSHLILPSGTYFSLDSEELRQLARLIAEARSLSDGGGDGVRLSRFQASLWEDISSLGVISAQAASWEASVRTLTEASSRIDHPTPPGLQATLRPYQQEGFNWLAFLYEHHLGGILADDMGLGKTLQALALICHTTQQGLTTSPYLVIAPASVVQNWAAECRRFAPGLTAVTISETESRRRVPLAEVVARADVVIASYALFRLEYEDYQAIPWAGLFVDEAQFVKNRHSKTHQQIKMLPVPFKLAMTGTPMENNLMELWSLLSIAAPGLFPSPDRFEEQYRLPIEKHGDPARLDRLRRRIRPLMLRRTKDQVAADLPEKQEQLLVMDLAPKHKKLYQTYLARERQKVLGLLGDMSNNRFEIFRSLTLLRQASLDVSLIDSKHAKVPSTKLDALMGMVDNIVEDGHRVLVFSQFTRFLSQARRRMEVAGIEHCYLDGRTRKRAEVISEFRNGAAPVFLISLKAGGFGLNLTEADYCILLDPWWNPATEAQAVDRVHRIGQTRKVMVYRLVANDTIEEKVMALKARKAALFANVIDAGEFESGALTAADIRELVS